MRGRLDYTLTSVAFPNNPRFDSVVDDLSIGYAAKGGGTEGEFTVRWHDFSNVMHRKEEPAMSVQVFADGLNAFYAKAVQDVFATLAKRKLERRNVTPEQLIRMLEKRGARPSHYHAQGMLGRIRSGELPYSEQVKWQAAYDEAKTWEQS